MKACGYHNMRNRAVGRGNYRPGFKFYEVDLLVRWLRDNGVRFCVADRRGTPDFAVCGRGGLWAFVLAEVGVLCAL